MQIGLFYGSSTCYTEIVAEKIRDIIGNDLVRLHNIKDTPVAKMRQYDLLILGIPTWDFGVLQEDWENCWQELAATDLQGQVVALFGLGDQEGYSRWFQDALGLLYQLLTTKGVTTIGCWDTAGYNFVSEKALTENGKQFVGLALDEVNQFELTDRRIYDWCEQILTEYAAILSVSP